MTIRKDVSAIQNLWHDAQRVDETDCQVEQDHNSQIHSATIQNHFGSGVLLENVEQLVIFDSDELSEDQASILAAGNFDGTGLEPTNQPSDINLGNQIEIELTDSNVLGRLCTRVAIIGLAFDGTMQMDKFYFYKNEKQVTSKHYKRILTIFFSDFKGNNFCSRNNGGRVVIREAKSFQLSRDPIMTAQDIEPDIFWRDFKLATITSTVFEVIQTAIGADYNADSLDINITGRPDRTLEAGDVTSQVGEKFLAYTNNIQKITLLLGAERNDLATEDAWFDWTGDLVVSIYALQTTVKCPSAIVPELSIDFDPENEPLVQLSYSQAELEDIGYVLTDVLQPVDFVFNATKLGSGTTSKITAGNYYAITMKRSGAANSGKILIGVGNDRLDDARVTLFSSVWTDVEEEDLWFQVWTDAAKIADGQGYDDGIGILYAKTTVDSETGATIDYEVGHQSFISTGEGVLNTGLLQNAIQESFKEQDERTGNDTFARKQYVPSFSFLTDSSLEDLQSTSEPVIIGCIKDINAKQNDTIESIVQYIGQGRGDTLCIINPDADLLSNNLLGSKLYPNISYNSSFRIFKVTACTDGYGDVNGDGEIDSSDISAASALIGESLYYTSTQQRIIDGYVDLFELLRADVDGDGYISSNDVDLITNYVNKNINSFPVGTSFTHMCLKFQQNTGRFDGYYDCDGYVRLDGYVGTNIVDPSTLTPWELLYDGYLSTPVIEIDPAYTTVPFIPLTFRIIHHPFWQPYMLIESSEARTVPAIFSSNEKVTENSCSVPLTFNCTDTRYPPQICDPGRNDFYVPDNLIIGKGQILRPSGELYKHDLEIGTIILNLPDTPISNADLNVFDKFIADHGEGWTSAGYPAMRYADCSTVQPEDLSLGRVKFNVSIQAIVPQLDGYDSDGYDDGYGIIIDDIIGVYFDHTTGIMMLTAKDQHQDALILSLISKIQIIVYLKKAGWNQNNLIIVEPNQLAGLLS